MSFCSSSLFFDDYNRRFCHSRIFTKSEIEEIRKIRLWDVVTNTTTIKPDAIQRKLFVWMKDDPCPQPFQLNSSMLEPCMPLQRHDYFEVIFILHFQTPNNFVTKLFLILFLQGSELVYIYACVFLGFIPILCAGVGYGLVKLQNRRRRRLKILQEEIQKRNDARICVDKMVVREWLHANHRRLVKVKFGPEAALYVVNRKGEKLRTFNFNNISSITVEESQVIIGNSLCSQFCGS